MNTKLTIQEKLKDLRIEKGLTLEELAAHVKIARATLSNYENDDYKDISHHSIIALAKFYGVTTDYLLGMTENRKQTMSSTENLHLDDETITLLENKAINTRLLCEIIKHPAFEILLQDIEILVDGHAAMQLAALNNSVDSIRQMIKERFDPASNDIYMKTLVSAHIDEYQYFYAQIHRDIEMIVRDVRRSHANDSTSSPDASSYMQSLKDEIAEIESAKGTPIERQTKYWLSRLKIKYDSLTPEELSVQMRILQKSPLLKSHISQRGKKRKR